jgi:hypothetical protein
LCIWGGITVLILFLIEAELMMQHGAWSLVTVIDWL